MENPTPSSSILKIKPMLKEYTPITAIIKGGFVDESISSKSAEIFTYFMNSILKHNQSSLIERVVDRNSRNTPANINKIKTNLSPLTLQAEPSGLNNVPIPEPPTPTEPLTPTEPPTPTEPLPLNSKTPLEVGGHKRGRTSKQSVKPKTQSKKRYTRQKENA